MRFTADEARNANYVCAALATTILVVRLGVSQWHRRAKDLSFWLVALSITVIIARLIINYFYLRYGTASDALNKADYFNTHDHAKIKKGSILSLVARVLITASCWLQISLLLLFYSKIIANIRWVRILIKICWFATISSFLAVTMTTFLECRPFHLYWQLNPNPGTCVRSYIQLLIQGISNTAIDLGLLAISVPLLRCKRTFTQHLRVWTLFLLGTFCIIVTALRLVSIYASGSAQPTRSFWASIQMLVSTFVANVPTVYGDLKIQKRKRSEPMLRRQSGATLISSPSNTQNPFRDFMPVAFPERVFTGSSTESKPKEWFDGIDPFDTATLPKVHNPG